MKSTKIEGYLVGYALAESGPEPVGLYLYDLPGCGVQAKSLPEAMEKLRALVPEYLKLLRERGVALPEPSPEPGFQFEQMEWAFGVPFVAHADRLNQAVRAEPIAVVRRKKPDGVQQVEIGRPTFGKPVPV